MIYSVKLTLQIENKNNAITINSDGKATVMAINVIGYEEIPKKLTSKSLFIVVIHVVFGNAAACIRQFF